MNLKLLCLKMDYRGFWRFVTARKNKLEALRLQMPLALGDCVNLAKFVLEVISEKVIVLFKPVSCLPVFSLHQFLHSSHYDMKRLAEEDDETVQNNANRCIGVAPWILS
ncbi:unnamed protein product [Malus baccata var. baccata]